MVRLTPLIAIWAVSADADDLIVAAGIFDQAARLRSYELLAEAMR